LDRRDWEVPSLRESPRSGRWVPIRQKDRSVGAGAAECEICRIAGAAIAPERAVDRAGKGPGENRNRVLSRALGRGMSLR
jgi:hypothetical protein